MRSPQRGRWREDLPARPWRWLLLPAWLAYRPAVALRNALYDVGWRRAHRLPVPVIAIGNLVAGGAGKTPAVRAVIDRLRDLGRAPTVISRGYRALPGSGAAGALANDEALAMGDAPVVCDPDRVAGGRRAIAAGADCLVLDDGFQHRRLHRDLDIVVVDATRPWGDAAGGRGAVLPLGYLREGRGGMRRAGLLWISRSELVDAGRLAAVERALAPLGVPIIRERETASRLVPLHGADADDGVPSGSLAGNGVVLATGLGNPLGVERSLARRGIVIAEHLVFPDHHRYSAADARIIADAVERHGATLVTTTKDAVKLAPLLSRTMPALVLRTTIGFAPGDEQALRGALAHALSWSAGVPDRRFGEPAGDSDRGWRRGSDGSSAAER